MTKSDHIYYQIQKDNTSKVMSIDAAGNQQMVVLSDEGELINFDTFGNSIVLLPNYRGCKRVNLVKRSTGLSNLLVQLMLQKTIATRTL